MMSRYVLCFVLFLVSFQGISQINPAVLSIEKIEEAEVIAEAEVIDKQSFWDSNHLNIYTSYRLKIVGCLKGSLPGIAELIVKGGIADNIRQTVSSVKEFNIGDRGFFLLRNLKPNNSITANTGKRFLLAGGSSGFVETGGKTLGTNASQHNWNSNEILQLIEKSAQKLLFRSDLNSRLKSSEGLHTITDFSPKVVTAGTGALLTIYGSGFGNTQSGSTIWFTYSDMIGQIFSSSDFEIKQWSDSVISLNVPSKAATGNIIVKIDETDATSNQVLTVKYAHTNMNNLPTLLIDTDNSGGYTWHLHSNIDSVSQAREIVEKSINYWVCATSVPWFIGDTISGEVGKDGRCTISFGTVEGPGEETLGQTNSFYVGAPYPDTEYWVLKEADIVLVKAGNWSFSRESITSEQLDFESILLHELGHAHLLDHVNNENDLMYCAMFRGITKDIGSDNILCGEYILDKSGMLDYPKYKPVIPYFWEGPEIGTKGDTLFSVDEFQSYQWYGKNGEIANATGREYVIDKSGEYYLEVRNERGCSKSSASRFMVKTSTGYFSKLSADFSVFPNPSNGIFSVGFQPNITNDYSVILTNPMGQILEKRVVKCFGNDCRETFNLPHLNPGLYFLTVSSGRQRISKKIVVQ